MIISTPSYVCNFSTSKCRISSAVHLSSQQLCLFLHNSKSISGGLFIVQNWLQFRWLQNRIILNKDREKKACNVRLQAMQYFLEIFPLDNKGDLHYNLQSRSYMRFSLHEEVVSLLQSSSLKVVPYINPITHSPSSKSQDYVHTGEISHQREQNTVFIYSYQSKVTCTDRSVSRMDIGGKGGLI